MKTKLFTLLLVLTANIGTTFASTKIGDLYYNLNASAHSAEVTSGVFGGYSGNITIPSSVTYNNVEYSVTSIRSFAFERCNNLTSVTIPNSVTSIGGEAFFHCSNLAAIYVSESNNYYSSMDGILFNKDKTTLIKCPETIQGHYNIPSSVTSILSGAFRSSRLTSISFSNVKSIGHYAFSGCSGLTSVTIGYSVTSIGDNAFEYCTGLTRVMIGNTVTSIGNGAFLGCSNMTSVTIPNSVTSIGYEAFRDCTSLLSVIIPNSVTSIGTRAFRGCTNLTIVAIPSSITRLGTGLFSGCSRLTIIANNAATPQTVNYPEEYEDEDEVFYLVNQSSCTLFVPKESINLYKSAYLWRNFGRIEESPIAYGTCGADGGNIQWVLSCDSVLTLSGSGEMADYTTNSNVPWNAYAMQVKALVIEDGITSIGDWAFSGCSRLTSVTIPNSVTKIGNAAFFQCSALAIVTIPSSVISIGESAFSLCSSLTSIEIPNSVTEIGNGAFSYCSGLTSPVYNAHVFAYLPNTYSGAYIIPDGIEKIAGSAFYQCSGMTSVIIPSSVISIGDYAFYKCSGLFTMEIPNGVTSIGEAAFQQCQNLVSVTIPSSVNHIKIYAFYQCTALTSIINYATTPQEIHMYVFRLVDYSNCILYVPEESIDLYKAAYIWENFTNIVAISETPTDIETVSDIQTNNEWKKILRNGQILILRGDKTYTIQGQQIK